MLNASSGIEVELKELELELEFDLGWAGCKTKHNMAALFNATHPVTDK
jgi:hypothetical protein